MTPTRPTGVRYLVLAWFCALALLAYVHRNCLSVPAEQVGKDSGLSEEDLGYIFSAFFWGYAFLQIPSGWLVGRLGSRGVVTLLILLWSLANGLTGLALGFWFLLSCRFAMGMAQAGLFPGAVQSFGRWFPPTQRAMPSGYLAAFMSLGGALATALTGIMLDFFTWQSLMVLYAVPGIFMGILFWWWFRDFPADHPGVNAEELALIQSRTHPTSSESSPPNHDALPWWKLIFNLDLFWVCLQQCCRAAAYIFYATWWPKFLQESRGLTVTKSGLLGSLPLLGVVLGSALGGQMMDWIYRRTGSLGWSRRGLAILTLLASAAFMVLGYWADDLWFTLFFLTLSCIGAGACGPASYTITIDMGGRHVATVFSVMNMAGNIGAALFPIVALAVKDQGTWDDVLLLSAGLYLVAALCWMMVGWQGRKVAGTLRVP